MYLPTSSMISTIWNYDFSTIYLTNHFAMSTWHARYVKKIIKKFIFYFPGSCACRLSRCCSSSALSIRTARQELHTGQVTHQAGRMLQWTRVQWRLQHHQRAEVPNGQPPAVLNHQWAAVLDGQQTTVLNRSGEAMPNCEWAAVLNCQQTTV